MSAAVVVVEVEGSHLGTRLKGAAGPWQRCSAPGRWRRRGAVWGRTSCYRRSLLHPAQASGSLSPGAAAWRDRGPVQQTARTHAHRRNSADQRFALKRWWWTLRSLSTFIFRVEVAKINWSVFCFGLFFLTPRFADFFPAKHQIKSSVFCI